MCTLWCCAFLTTAIKSICRFFNFCNSGLHEHQLWQVCGVPRPRLHSLQPGWLPQTPQRAQRLWLLQVYSGQLGRALAAVWRWARLQLGGCGQCEEQLPVRQPASHEPCGGHRDIQELDPRAGNLGIKRLFQVERHDDGDDDNSDDDDEDLESVYMYTAVYVFKVWQYAHCTGPKVGHL